MGAFDKNPGSRAQAEMEDAAQRAEAPSREEFQEKLRLQTGDEKFARTYRNRGRLYDKIPFSLHTMDVIIFAIVVLIVVLIVVGIVIGQ